MLFLRSSWGFSCAILLAVASASTAHAGATFEGIYKGSMNLFGKKKPIPLAVSLVLTSEYTQIANGNGVLEQQQVIDAAFIVDDEGGPYGFYKVSYNLDKSLIDLRYNRPTVTTTMVSIPSSFRLIGKVLRDGTISGKVISGQDGPIGTFSISRDGVDQDFMSPVTKYVGRWAGTARLTPENKVIPFALRIDRAGMVTLNPNDLELDFTPGKVGSYTWRDVDLVINKIVVDYLRRKLFMMEMATDSSLGTSVNLEIDLDSMQGNELTGTMGSMYRGKRGTFKLKRIP